jgi:hypothetical protein
MFLKLDSVVGSQNRGHLPRRCLKNAKTMRVLLNSSTVSPVVGTNEPFYLLPLMAVGVSNIAE